MRTLEIVLVVTAVAAVARGLAGRVGGAWLPGPGVMSGCLLFALALQIVVEGARWQMLPAYCVATLLPVALAFGAAGAPLLFRLALLSCGGGALIAATAISLILPVFRLPPPTGPFAVGTVELTLPTQQGPLPATLWYPAEPASGAPAAPYQAGVTSVLGRYRELVRTHAATGARFAPAAAPADVILCLPGWDGRRTDNTALAEDLASHGYVVAAMDDRVPMGGLEFGSAAAYAATLARGAAKAATEASEALQVLDGLERLNAADPAGRFTGRLATGRAGIVGFSFGGAVGATAARLDPRIRAVVNMDGWLFGPAAEQGVPVPYMMLNDDEPMPTPAALGSPDATTRYTARFNLSDWQAQMRAAAAHGGEIVTLRGTQHANFSDGPFRSPLRRLTGAGPVDPRRAQQLIRAYCLAFFDHILRGQSAPLLDQKNAPPDVVINLAMPPAAA
jgi:predicted dienelactone hydrolase